MMKFDTQTIAGVRCFGRQDVDPTHTARLGKKGQCWGLLLSQRKTPNGPELHIWEEHDDNCPLVAFAVIEVKVTVIPLSPKNPDRKPNTATDQIVPKTTGILTSKQMTAIQEAFASVSDRYTWETSESFIRAVHKQSGYIILRALKIHPDEWLASYPTEFQKIL